MSDKRSEGSLLFNVLFFLEGIFLKKYVRAEKGLKNSTAVPCAENTEGSET